MSAASSDRTAPPTSTPPPAAPAPSTPVPVPTPQPAVLPPQRPAHSPAGRILLATTGALLVGWLSWLGYTALTKSHTPIISRAQAAAATVPVRVKLTTGNKELRAAHERRGAGNTKSTTSLRGEDDRPAFLATVVEQLTPTGPARDSQLGVANLPAATGYTGPGEYLLLLVKDDGATIDGHPAYYLVGQQRPHGSDLADIGPPMIYPWTDKTAADLHQQVKRLFP